MEEVILEVQKNSICVLVQELLPVYFDKCISEECKAVVEAHIKECPNCRTRLDEVKTDTIGVETNIKEDLPVDLEETKKFAAISKRLKHRRIRNLFITVSIIGALFIGYTNCFLIVNSAGNSMVPTINAQEYCMVFRHAYAFTQPKKGDIIIASVDTISNGATILKRVVGVPGDTIEIRGGKLYVNGENNSFYNGITTPTDTYAITVPEDTFFLLGDNFNYSYDSRYEEHGCVSIDDIWGKCILYGNMLKNPFDETSSIAESSEVE